MKCTKEDCSNEAEYVVSGQSVCKAHKEADVKEVPKPNTDNVTPAQTAGEKMVGDY